MEHNQFARRRSHQARPASEGKLNVAHLFLLAFPNYVLRTVLFNQVVPLGLGSQHSQHHYFTNSSSRTEALQGLTHRLGDSIHNLYYNRSSYNSPRLRGWLNSFHDLNVTDNTYKIKDYISGKTGAALQGINELGRQGVKGVSELGMRGVQSMRGAAAQSYLGKHNNSATPS